MNNLKRLIWITGFLVLAHLPSYSKAIPILVDSIFPSITEIKEVKILAYPGDSVLVFLDIATGDTGTMNCKWKKHSDNIVKHRNEMYPEDSTWETTFPGIGESVTMLTYKLYGGRVLFARKEEDNYRFWDPRSLPFANSVFYFGNIELYKPTKICSKSYDTNTKATMCPDGFLIAQKEFDKIRAKYKR